jgi:beta-galactosidase/beta-glucuronidase
MLTEWGEMITADNVWQEYPRPQLQRDRWFNLNGLWNYAIESRTKPKPESWQGQILVPFAVESELSGVQRQVTKDQRLWYERSFQMPPDWKGSRIYLNIGAVDYEAVIWINDAYVGSHQGGFDAIRADITEFLNDGDNILTLACWDPSSLGEQPRGKQHVKPQGIWYTSVTGIWQTVWLEPVDMFAHIEEIRIRPDLGNESISVDLLVGRPTTQQTLGVRITVLDQGSEIVTAMMRPDRRITLTIPNVHPWSTADPHLYDLRAELVRISNPSQDEEDTERVPRHGRQEADRYLNAVSSGEPLDSVTTYFGMRDIKIGPGHVKDQPCLLLNGQPEFQLGTLDQGWWPDGLHTPASDEAIIYELTYLKDAGFNALRKHIKVESARYYYHCDRLGILVWQDMPSGFAPAQHVAPADESDQVRKSSTSEQFELEFRRIMNQLGNHPSIVMWVIFNEGWGQAETVRLTRWVKDLDPGRVVNSVSGWLDMGTGEINDRHDYSLEPGVQEPDPFRALVIGEFGGIGWPVQGHLWDPAIRNWGYQTYHDLESVQQAYRKKLASISGMHTQAGVIGAIYTQTSDVEGEVNGLLSYDRRVEKLSREWLNKLHGELELSSVRLDPGV